ncbi:MAG TPA: hypothetical protein DDW52_05480 [Planctomycetaceae bacterium]|nr:hypothetical protein [Planctomycetaceae bacterium]
MLGNSQRATLYFLAVLGFVVSSVGCVRRRMLVRTNPPGAAVYVDKQEIGISPISTDYIYYGNREIEVTADGYDTVKVIRDFKPPIYQWPVIDFFAETLWPFELRDQRTVDIEMPVARARSREELTTAGEAMRIQAASATLAGTPQIPGGAAPAAPIGVPESVPINPPVYQQPVLPPQSAVPYQGGGLQPTRIPEVGILQGGGMRPPVESPSGGR